MRSRKTPLGEAAAMVVTGYHESPAPVRVLFGMTTSFAVTVASSRTLNYVREQRRAVPKLRALGRLLAQAPGSNSIRVHHFLPGMVAGFMLGGTHLLIRAERLERWLSVPFGASLALTTDELRILVGRNNPYWGGEGFAWAQGAIAGIASLGLGVGFLYQGHATARQGLDRRATSAGHGVQPVAAQVTGS